MECGLRGKCQNYLTLTGLLFILLPGNVDVYWSSASVYALSFFVSRHHYNSQIQSPWTLSAFYVCWTVGFIASGFLSKHLGVRWTLFAGSVISNVAILSCYFTIKSSFLLFNGSLGVISAIGYGIIFGNAIQLVVYTTETRLGLFTSLLMVSSSVGTFIMTQMTTWYVNPGNKSPDYNVGAMTYFTQKDVIDKVPSMFLFVGVFSLTSNVIGLVLLNVPTIVRALSKNHRLVPNVTETISLNENRFRIECAPQANSEQDTIPSCQQEEYSPKEVLKTATFHALCLSFLITNYSNLVVGNYYKLFGQIWIHDDHFLTDLSTAFTIAMAVFRLVNGFMLDALGCKNCLVIIVSTLVIVAVWFYFTAMVNLWLYFFVTVLYVSIGGALYSSYFSVVALIFGKTHLTANMSIIFIVFIVFNLVAPYIIDAILTSFGWSILFISAGGLQIVNLVLCMVFVR